MRCTKVGKYGTGKIVNCLSGKKKKKTRRFKDASNKSQVSYLMPAQTQPDIFYKLSN